MSGREETDAAPGCARFEATLALVDGLLSGLEAAAAEAHAEACATCGALADGWAASGAALREAFEDAAEAAKPRLSGLAERVLAESGRATGRTANGAQGRAGPLAWLWSALEALEAPVAVLAAAGAIALVLAPAVRPASSPGPEAGGGVSDLHEPEFAELDDEEVENAGPNGCSVDELVFEGAHGMLMTAGDDMTVIWVNEDDGA